jgi:DNA-binding MarR family transcriptional regulator
MTAGTSEQAAREVWAVMNNLVLDNERRREVSQAVGLPFSRVRALLRVGAASMTVGELATALGVDPPNCTPIVDYLERRGLVERRPHPTDRRSKLVVVTPAGSRLAKRAQRLLDRPPATIREMPAGDLRALTAIFARATSR